MTRLRPVLACCLDVTTQPPRTFGIRRLIYRCQSFGSELLPRANLDGAAHGKMDHLARPVIVGIDRPETANKFAFPVQHVNALRLNGTASVALRALR